MLVHGQVVAVGLLPTECDMDGDVDVEEKVLLVGDRVIGGIGRCDVFGRSTTPMHRRWEVVDDRYGFHSSW